MTKEVVYNEYEIELLDLIDYTINNFRKATADGKVQQEFLDGFIKKYEFVKENVIRYANERYDIVEFFKDKKLEQSKLYYDDTCTHCKFHSSFQPIGDAAGEMGFRFYLFNCPKCNQNFVAQNPFDMHENLAWMEHSIKIINEEDEHGNSIRNSNGHTPEEYELLLKTYNDFKESVKVLDNSLAKEKDIEEQDIQQLIPQIAYLKEIKKLMTESQDTEEIN